MFAVNKQPNIICIKFEGNAYTDYFTLSMSERLKMKPDEFVHFLRKNFKCYFNGNEAMFFTEQEAQKAVDGLNVLYKLLKAK